MIVTLLKAFFAFTISYLLAYSLGKRLKLRKAKWIALTYSFVTCALVLSEEYSTKLLLTIVGATAIIAVAVATAPRKTETPLYPRLQNIHSESENMVKFEKIYETPGEKERIVVLWVSRHPPLKVQIQSLEEKLGGIVVYQLSGMIPNAEFVAEKAREVRAKYIVPVLPLSFIARLTELARREGFIVLWAEMQQVAQGEGEPPEVDSAREVVTIAHGTWKVMRFKQFHIVRAVKLELEPF